MDASASSASSAALERIAARADLCRLLAACCYEPGAELAEERVFDSLFAAAARIDAALGDASRRLGASFAASELQDLLIDYTQLFLGPVGAPARPYGSVWLDAVPELMQPSTLAVIELYGAGGFEIADDFLDLPDHIAVELEFLYHLLFREARALRQADADGLTAARALRRRFLAEHLGRWIEPFTTAIRDHARSDYYRALAELTRAFVLSEAQQATMA